MCQGQIPHICLGDEKQQYGGDHGGFGGLHCHAHEQGDESHAHQHEGMGGQLHIEHGPGHIDIYDKRRLQEPGGYQDAQIDGAFRENQCNKAEDPHSKHLGNKYFPAADRVGEHQIHDLVLICSDDKIGEHDAGQEQERHTGKQFNGGGDVFRAGGGSIQCAVRVCGNPQKSHGEGEEADDQRDHYGLENIFSDSVLFPFQSD